MGRKTAESLGRALPRRENLVLTRSGSVPFAGMQPVASLAEAIERADGSELMVIGGGEIYALTLSLANRLYLTYVDTTVAGAEAFFPPINQVEWRVTDRAAHGVDEKHAYAFEFVDYERVALLDRL
jgi:dihydrofolate reductase